MTCDGIDCKYRTERDLLRFEVDKLTAQLAQKVPVVVVTQEVFDYLSWPKNLEELLERMRETDV